MRYPVPPTKPVKLWTTNSTPQARLRAMAWCQQNGIESPGDVKMVEFYQEKPGPTEEATAYVYVMMRGEDGHFTDEVRIVEVPISVQEFRAVDEDGQFGLPEDQA